MRTRGAVGLFGMLACAVLAEPGRAGQPSAIVESIQSATAGIEPMEYLEPGKVISLAPSDKLVVSYLHSCARETITGGMLIVGQNQSAMKGGAIDRTTIRCSTGRIAVASGEAQRVGAVVSRSIKEQVETTASTSARPALPKPTDVLLGLPAILETGAPGRLSIERLDKTEPATVIDVRPAQLTRGRFVDLANLKVKLVAGGMYRVRMDAREILLQVDPNAQSTAPALLTRLVRMPPT